MVEEEKRSGTTRRKEVRRLSDREVIERAEALSRARTIVLVICLVIMPILMIRSGIISYPSWMPLWLVYPEVPISHMLNQMLH